MMFSIFRKKIASQCQVVIEPSDISLQINRGENLLEAVQRRGLSAPFNCRVGACKTCQISVKQGTPKSLIEREYVFSQEEIHSGAYLACQLRVESDMQIVWPGLTVGADKAAAGYEGQLLSIRPMTPRIHRIEIQLNSPLQWRPGQYAKILPEGFDCAARCYSLVNRGSSSTVMCFDITQYSEGAVSSWLTNPRHIGKRVQLEAPFGSFGDLKDSDLEQQSPPLLCIAGGSGMGAISGILNDRSAAGQLKNPVVLVYGARDHTEIYGLDKVHELTQAANVPHFSCPVLDREPENSKWQGRRGYIAPHLEQILEESVRHNPSFKQPLDQWRVLLCGPTVMVESSIAALRACGVRPEHVSFDKYEQHSA